MAFRLIDANEIEELFYKQVEWGATDLMDAFDDALQDAQTVMEIGNCEGCIWAKRKRPQKCSCCRRNLGLKDCYERDRSVQ